jgi:hypothetical protein
VDPHRKRNAQRVTGRPNARSTASAWVAPLPVAIHRINGVGLRKFIDEQSLILRVKAAMAGIRLESAVRLLDVLVEAGYAFVQPIRGFGDRDGQAIKEGQTRGGRGHFR